MWSARQLRRIKEAALVKRGRFQTCGRNNVSYYRIHCCIMLEILPIEKRGYSMWINPIGDKPEDFCFYLYYKKPVPISEGYFGVIGEFK